MKKLATSLILCAAAFALSATMTFAEGSAETPIVTTLLADGSTNTWTQADLIAALQLMNRKYHRDVETPDGRKSWHGALVAQIVDTNALVKIERYADGTEFAFPFTTPKSTAPTPASKSANVPTRLVAARARRAAERETTNIVTVVVTPDK